MRSLEEVLLGIALTLVSVLIHSIGMYLVMHRFELHWPRYLSERKEWRRQLYFLLLVIMILFTHLLEILTIASTMKAVHAIEDFRTAFYFAGETYTTLGYGDVLLPAGWRQLALFIAMSGLLSFGWTTGVLVSIVGKTYDAQFSHLRQQPRDPAHATQQPGDASGRPPQAE
ncbi:MAG: two pore domain potassium channel family protein [Betaproteobacteria bacterium]|nr:two pore domain potassium channel family protein [Betaproteobacteria bacterium]